METDFQIENNVLVEYDGDDSHVVIPDGVVEIGSEVFSCCEMESVTIPESVVRIADSAFEYCENLESVVLPSGLKHLGANAFSGCEKLTEIEIPSGVKRIGDNAFDGCVNLRKVVLSEGLEYIGDEAFMFCSALEEINYPSTLKRLGEYAFAECERLMSKAPSDVESEYTSYQGTLCDKEEKKSGAGSWLKNYNTSISGSTHIKKRTLYRGETVADLIGKDEKVYIELKSKKSSVRKAAFGSMFVPVLIWILFDGGILIGMTVGGVFAANPMMLLILLFFAVHLLPVWIWIGGIVRAAKYGNASFVVTDRKVYVHEINKVTYIRLIDIERAKSSGKSKVTIIDVDGQRLDMDGIERPKAFADSLNELVEREKARE